MLPPALLHLLAGCSYTVDADDTGVRTTLAPIMTLSATDLAFGVVTDGEPDSRTVSVHNGGGVPMAVRLAWRGDPFCASWGAGVTCPDGSASASRRRHRGSRSAGGTGSAPDSPVDTSGGGEVLRRCLDGSPESDPEEIEVIPPGCWIDTIVVYDPVYARDAYGHLTFETEWVWNLDSTGYIAWGDTENRVQEVLLSGGDLSDGAGALEWTDPALAFAWRWPDGTREQASTIVTNVGALPVEISAFDLSSCPEAEVLEGPAPGDVVSPGAEVPVSLGWTASSSGSTRCVAVLTSTEGAASNLVLTVTAPPHSDPPVVTITAPAPGEAVPTDTDYAVTFNVSDDLTPVDALSWSATVGAASFGPGTPSDSTVSFTAHSGGLEGPRVIKIVVTDAQSETTTVTLPIRIGTVPAGDADLDGALADEGDCDDLDARTYLDAAEVADGKDNDCDGLIDEDTTESDDDRDGVTEADGDCDDGDAGTYPGANEYEDRTDNDCDGVLDEGSQSADDDGDGWSEARGDCDDARPGDHPGADERCDGGDNDCDHVADELDDCVGPVGMQMADDWFVRVAPDACTPGDVVRLELVSPAPETLSVEWGSDDEWAFTPTGPRSATAFCGETSSARNVVVFTLFTDEEGHQLWGQQPVALYPSGTQLSGTFVEGEARSLSTPCNPAGRAAAAAFSIALVATLVRRRSRPFRPGTP